MNLKEAFRYQNFLDRIFGAACISIEKRDHCLTQTRNHLYNKVNPDMENVKEEVKTEEDFFANDDVIQAMLFLIEEKEKLSIAINKAKESIDMDIDAAVSVNKYRQLLNKSVAFMMRLILQNNMLDYFLKNFNDEKFMSLNSNIAHLLHLE